ncbi:hypothetical protein C4571_02585 [Candidatus Parcubacteria bacterium]|nr:MAG: hypothetical protein C4571_02585 [Candidatus Parcubacteria bacterium]
MSLRNTSAAVGGIVFLSFLALAPASFGEETGACNFRGDLEALKAVKAKFSGSTENLTAELGMRKQLLAKVTDCAIEETKQLKEKISSLPVNEPSMLRIQAVLREQLEEIVSRYENQKSQIKNLGLQGAQNFSRDLREWRVANHKPLAGKAENFITWAENQRFFQTAQARLNQIRHTVRILKLVDNEEIQELYERSLSQFEAAERTNKSLENAFGPSSSPEDSLALIKSSLEALAETYQGFSNLGDAVRKILPH